MWFLSRITNHIARTWGFLPACLWWRKCKTTPSGPPVHPAFIPVTGLKCPYDYPASRSPSIFLDKSYLGRSIGLCSQGTTWPFPSTNRSTLMREGLSLFVLCLPPAVHERRAIFVASISCRSVPYKVNAWINNNLIIKNQRRILESVHNALRALITHQTKKKTNKREYSVTCLSKTMT